jgi:hypothetical protein
MPSYKMLRRVYLVRTDVSEERIASIIKMTRYIILRNVLRLLVTANVVLARRVLSSLMMKVIRSSETSVITRVTLRNIQEDGVL